MIALTDQARQLSSGTIGSLIDCSEYETIDTVQGLFVNFCERYCHIFATWQDAWERFYVKFQTGNELCNKCNERKVRLHFCYNCQGWVGEAASEQGSISYLYAAILAMAAATLYFVAWPVIRELLARLF